MLEGSLVAHANGNAGGDALGKGGNVILGKSLVLTWIILDLWDSFAAPSTIECILGVWCACELISSFNA